MKIEKTTEQENFQKPILPINEKGLTNRYTKEHLKNKNIPSELVKQCLMKGEEVTDTLKAERRYTLKGHRYFKLELPDLDKKYIPGKITLPDPRGELAGEVVNWNFTPIYTIRSGRVVPAILESDLPDWLKKETYALYVIVAKNQRDDGVLLEKDGPAESDPGGSWFVVTAHFGPPSWPKPKVPDFADCANEKERAEKLKNYLEKKDAWQKENERTYYVIGEEEYKKSVFLQKPENYKKEELSKESLFSGVEELKNKSRYQQTVIDGLMKEIEKMNREIDKLSSRVSHDNKNNIG